MKILKEYNLNQGVGGLEYPTRAGSRLPGSFSYPGIPKIPTAVLWATPAYKTHGIDVFSKNVQRALILSNRNAT